MTQKKVVILGAGMVGSAMAADLARREDFTVTVVDGRPEALERVQQKLGVRTARADLSSPDQLLAAVEKADLVLGALASTLGLRTLKALLEAGKPYCDISFMAEN